MLTVFVKCNFTGMFAAAAESLQSCPTLCDPIDGSPPGSSTPGILQARTLEQVAISFSNAWRWKEKVKSLSRVWLLAIPGTAAYQAPPSMGFSRQEYWSGVPLPSPLERLILCKEGVGDRKVSLIDGNFPLKTFGKFWNSAGQEAKEPSKTFLRNSRVFNSLAILWRQGLELRTRGRGLGEHLNFSVRNTERQGFRSESQS